MDDNWEFGYNFFCIRPHGTSPMAMASIKTLVGSESVDIFPMFEGEENMFHYVIDAIDVKVTKVTPSSVDVITKVLRRIVQEDQYILAWCMFEGTFQDASELFKSEWVMSNTYAVCFKNEEPQVEMSDENRIKHEWKKILEKATSIITTS